MGNKNSAKKKTSGPPLPTRNGTTSTTSGKKKVDTPLHEDDFFFRPMGHHGLPHAVQAMAYCNTQRLLAVGTSTGIVKIFGGNGVEILIENLNSRSPIIFLEFNRSGSKLFTFSSDTEFRSIDTTTYKVLGGLSPGWTRGSHITCVHAPPDTDHPFLYVGLDSGYVEVINTLTTERTGYTISATSIDINPEEEDLIFIMSNPADLNRVLLGFEKSGPILWDFAKKKIVKRYSVPGGLAEAAKHDIDSNSLTCGAYHESGTQFVIGYSSGHIAVYQADKSSSGKLQPIAHAMSPVAYPKPVTKVRWGSNPHGKQRPGVLIIAGGNEMNAVTMLWPKYGGHHSHKTEWKCDEVGIPGLGEDCNVFGMFLPTWDESPVLDIAVTYPQGRGPRTGVADSFPNGYIIMSGDPQEGVHVRLGIQPLPAPRVGDLNARWPPAACDPPEPMPQILHFSGILRGMHVRSIVDCGVCPNEVIQGMKANRPKPHGHPDDWTWPISGGQSVSNADPKGAQHLLATGHIDGTVGIWACGPPVAGDNRVSLGQRCLSTSCECIYEFEPRFLCEQGGFKPPERPKPFAMTLCLQSRLLCIGCESGDVLVCTVKPGNRSDRSGNGGNGGNGGTRGTRGSRDTGSAVYLLHCIQGVHKSAIFHLALMAQSGKLAIGDRDGQVSMLDLETGECQLLPLPVPKVPRPIRSMIVGNVPMAADSAATKEGEEVPDAVAVPMLLVGFADGTIAACHIGTGQPLCLILPPGGQHPEPVNFMVLINKHGVPPIEPVTRKFTKTFHKNQPSKESKESANEATATSASASATTASATPASATPATPATDASTTTTATSSTTNDKARATSGSTTTEVSMMGIGRRFLLVVAGCDVRILELNFESLSSLQASGLKPKSIAASIETRLLSAPESISCASIFASNTAVADGEYPALVCIDNFNHMTCLSLPKLGNVYEEDITCKSKNWITLKDLATVNSLFILARATVVFCFLFFFPA